MSNVLGTFNNSISEKVFPGGVVMFGDSLENAQVITSGRFSYNAKSTETTKRTIYDIASITKIYTASLTLLLISEKRLRIYDKINSILYISTFPDVTIKHLLTHTSGVRLSLSSIKDLSKENIEKAILTTNPKTAPGASIYYSDPGYFILGKVLEKVTG